MLTDSHCHLDYPNLYNQLDDVVKRAEYNKVKYLLTICTTLKSFERIKLITTIIAIANITPYLALGQANLAILLGVLFILFSESFSSILKRAHN